MRIAHIKNKLKKCIPIANFSVIISISLLFTSLHFTENANVAKISPPAETSKTCRRTNFQFTSSRKARCSWRCPSRRTSKFWKHWRTFPTAATSTPISFKTLKSSEMTLMLLTLKMQKVFVLVIYYWYLFFLIWQKQNLSID